MKKLLTKYITYFKNSSFFRSVSILISGTFISQVIKFITIPIVSRLYTEQDYGEFAIFSSTAYIIIGIGPMGLTSAIMAPKETERSKDVFFTAFMISVLVFTVFFLGALIITPYFHVYETSMPYLQTLVLCYIFMILTTLTQLLSTYVNRMKRNRVLFWNSVIAAATVLLITIPLGFFGFGAMGFIIAGILGSVAAVIQMVAQENPFRKIISIKEMISVCKEYKDYILFQFPSNWIHTITIQIPNQMFSYFHGNAALGGYAMSERVLGYPIRLIANPVSIVYFRHATQYSHEGRIGDLGKFTYSFITKILKIVFLPTILFMIFSEQLFTLVLGDNWATAGIIASILAVQYVFRFCVQCISYCLVVLNKQRTNLKISVISLVIITLSIGLGVFLFDSITKTILCYAIGSTLVQMLKMSIQFFHLGIKTSKIVTPLTVFALGVVAIVIGVLSLI